MRQELRRIATLVIALTALDGGAVRAETYPTFDEGSAQPAVVVLRYTAGRHIEHFEACRKPDAICLDPPPMALTSTVERVLHGPSLPHEMTIYTTSHYGLDSFEFDAPQRSLALLFGSGNAWIMRRYARAVVLEDAAGEPTIPLRPEPIWWLPCDVAEARSEVTWADPEQVKWPREDAAADPDFYVLRGDDAILRYGVRIDAIADILARRNPGPGDLKCTPGDPATPEDAP